MDLLIVGAVSFAVGLSGALSPGPLTVLAIREAVRLGWWAGPLTTVGHGVMELVLVVALSLGLSNVLEDGSGMAIISLAGGTILLGMGWQLLKTPYERLQVELDSARSGVVNNRMPGQRALLSVASGAALASVANPYWILWWASVGTKLTVDSLAYGILGPGVFFTGHVLSDLAWLTLVTFVVGHGRGRMNPMAYRVLLITSAVFLLSLGLVFFLGGVSALI